jgi:hypothetical protein
MTTRVVAIFGYAAGRIADRLKKMGVILIATPEAFFIKGSKPILVEGETERAASWAKKIIH